MGGITQARKIPALAESHSIPVVPHAGQMHNYHIVMASLNSPMAEYFPPVDVEVGNELFWYIFKGEPMAKDGFVDLGDDVPGLGLTIKEEEIKKIRVYRVKRHQMRGSFWTIGILLCRTDSPYISGSQWCKARAGRSSPRK